MENIKYVVAPTLTLGNKFVKKLNLNEVKVIALENQIRGINDFTKENTLILDEKYDISKRVFCDGLLDIIFQKMDKNKGN